MELELKGAQSREAAEIKASQLAQEATLQKKIMIEDLEIAYKSEMLKLNELMRKGREEQANIVNKLRCQLMEQEKLQNENINQMRVKMTTTSENDDNN